MKIEVLSPWKHEKDGSKRRAVVEVVEVAQGAGEIVIVLDEVGRCPCCGKPR